MVIVRALAAVVILIAGLAANPAAAQNRVVNVYNWTDYINPAALEAFTSETGIPRL